MIAIRVCPIISLTIFSGCLPDSWRVAKVRRRSWLCMAGQLGAGQRADEVAAYEVVGGHVTAPDDREHEVQVLPGRPKPQSLLGLPDAVPAKPVNAETTDRHVADRLACLGLDDRQAALDPLQGAADPHDRLLPEFQVGTA